MKLKSSFKNKISLAVLVHTPIFAGIWTSLFFVTSGIITIAGSQSGVKGLVVATLVSSVLSAISATILFLIAFALVKRYFLILCLCHKVLTQSTYQIISLHLILKEFVNFLQTHQPLASSRYIFDRDGYGWPNVHLLHRLFNHCLEVHLH